MRKKMMVGGPAEKSDTAKLAKKLGPRKLKSGPVKTGEKSMKKKYKGFSKLPESVQMKINKKLAKKV